MEGFLYKVAERYVSEYGDSLKDFCFVFPNNRSSLFFRKYLGLCYDKPLFCPKLTTVSKLFWELSGLEAGDRIELFYILYQEYDRLCPKYHITPETFDEFVNWGDVILSDFGDIDKYLVDANAVFSNISDLRKLDTDYAFLSDRQRNAIRHFWNVLNSDTDKFEGKKIFKNTWMLLGELYVNYNNALVEKGIAYEGMMFRRVAELAKADNPAVHSALAKYKGIAIIGLNALCEAEKVFFDYIRDEFSADFHWDFFGSMVTDSDNKSSMFISENKSRYPSEFEIDGSVDYEPVIETITIPSSIGQAKKAAEYLSASSAESTSIVLPDEKLLMPLLNSLPTEINKINVTMGYALSNSAMSAFVIALASLQLNKRQKDGRMQFYYKDVSVLLNHPFLAAADSETIVSLKNDILKNNRILFSYNGDSELFNTIFTPVSDAGQACDWLVSIIDLLADKISDLEKEFAFGYHKAVVRIRDLAIPMSLKTFFRFLRQIAAKINVPFEGEPLQGLQIMGPLETRLLDFENVIILSVNEGVFPSKVVGHSFIPYNLRIGYGLPTVEQLDAIAAYHFYRSIYRAKKVILIYDSRQGGLNSGESSRFIKQLKYHYRKPLVEQVCTFEVRPETQQMDAIEKDSDVMAAIIGKYFEEGGNLSASSLNDYLDCPAKFYYKHLLGIQEQKDVSDDVEANEFGKVFHRTMQTLYSRFDGKVPPKSDLEKIIADKSGIDALIEKELREEKKLGDAPLRGKMRITVEVVGKLVVRTLRNDIDLLPFTYLAGEKDYRNTISLETPSGTKSVNILGFIDRLDLKDGRLRICDYKSGSVQGEMKFDDKGRNLANMFEVGDSKRPKYLFQTVLYAWLVRNSSNEYRNLEKDLVIYELKKIFDGPSKALPCPDVVIDDFERGLKELLGNIFAPDKPFIFCPDSKVCSFCPVNTICPKKSLESD